MRNIYRFRALNMIYTITGYSQFRKTSYILCLTFVGYKTTLILIEDYPRKTSLI